MKWIRWFLFLWIASVQAEHLGTFGQTFEIAESDLLETIQLKLQALEAKGGLSAHQDQIQAKLTKRLQRPLAVENMRHTTQERVFQWDPSIQVQEDLMDHQNQIFIKAGTRVNPLATHSLSKPLLLIDGDEPSQVQWAMHDNPSNAKIVLVKGAPLELTEKHDRVFYFDQGGFLVKKLGIEQVPARISQEASLLKIEELKCAEKRMDS